MTLEFYLFTSYLSVLLVCSRVRRGLKVRTMVMPLQEEKPEEFFLNNACI